ncbi:hypothetical protein EDB84DRAFT_1485502 [Lactarius hengduanensis]|nr:hypothetical protein EDB84DRAFT_1485502 [Lactarius hengduanensis]
MSSPSRANQPQHGTSSSNNPPSPEHLRHRGGVASSTSIFVTGGFRETANVSPTLSSFSSTGNISALAGRDGSGLATHGHKVSIRVDHSIATCFDPADKELYDLWAPKT